MNFKIYLKDVEDAEIIVRDCVGFSVTENSIALLNSAGKPTQFALVKRDSVVAIIPEKQDASQQGKVLHFQLYLRGKAKPVEVIAHLLDHTTEPSVTFYWLGIGRGGNVEKTPIPYIYVASADVVAIVPSEALPQHNFN